MATINGTSGNDTLNGTFTNDTINGFGGDDTINGGAGADVIDGGAGNDTINGGGGNDTITGGTGNDTLTGGTGIDKFIFKAGDGADVITDLAAGEIVEIHGYSAAQSITQDGSRVVVVLSSGDRIIFYNTTVATAQAALQFQGGGGGSTINGTSGDDTLHGTNGDDTIYGLGGNDTINGHGGNDRLSGGAGADVIDGGDGNDTLFSGDTSPPWSLPYYDNPYSPPLLDTGSEVDTLSGGAGWDVIFAGYGDHVDGGEGIDYLYISFLGAASGVSVDFRLETQTIGGGTITGIENISWVQGSNFDDYINVSSHADGNGYSEFTALFGMGGNDHLVAGYYTGVIDGGDGNDIVDGRGSQYLQAVYGGVGDDILYTNTNTFAVAYGGDGNDTIYAHGEIRGGAGDDTIYVVNSYYPGLVNGDDGNDTIYGSDNADQLYGGDGDDRLFGAAGDDTLNAGAGHDILNGGLGADTMIGGLGNDRYYVDNAGDVIVEAAGEGDDRLLTSVSYTLAAGVLVETLGTTNEYSTAAINITGNELGQSIYGNSGNNILDGGAGNDYLIGGLGADTLIGGTGNDTFRINDSRAVIVEYTGEGDDSIRAAVSYTLNSGAMVETMTTTNGSSTAAINLTGNEIGQSMYGNAGANVLNGAGGNDYLVGLGGNDTLIGGAGMDTMVGGAGNDRFVFSTASDSAVNAPDRILDFTTGDLIDLAGIDANTALANDQAFTFVSNSAFSNTAGELRSFQNANGTWTVEGDVNGDGIADFAIIVTSATPIMESDFIL